MVADTISLSILQTLPGLECAMLSVDQEPIKDQEVQEEKFNKSAIQN
jgi:hypothetical protein